MDILLISLNDLILHISNQEDKIDYTIYDNHCNLLDGGILDLENEISDENAIRNVVDIVKDQFQNLEPCIRVPNEITDDLLELIQEADYQNMLEKVQQVNARSR